MGVCGWGKEKTKWLKQILPLSLMRPFSVANGVNNLPLLPSSSSSSSYLLVAADGAFSVSSGGKTLSRTTNPTVPVGQPVRMPAETKRRG